MAAAFVVSVVVSLIVCLGVAGVDGNVKFSTVDATEDTFSNFMKDLRTELTKEGSQQYDIPVLSVNKRFVLVDLSNSQDTKNTLRVAINGANAYVLGYCACQDSPARAYFYKDTADADIDALFPEADRKNKFKLNFNGTYPQLEKYAKVNSRGKIKLGMNELIAAISNLWKQGSKDDTLAKSSLVLIQMVSEAARYRFIEARIAASLYLQDRSFMPDSAMLELETSWGKLSDYIQQSVQGVFTSAVQVNGVKVDSIYLYYVKGIAMVKNLKSSTSLPLSGFPSSALRLPRIVMPLEGANSNYYYYYDGGLDQSSPKDLFLNGAQGLCANVQSGEKVQLSSCGTQTSKWTLVSVNANKGEVKIEQSSSGKCLSGQGNAGSSVNVASKSECSKSSIAEYLKWKLSLDGTITNAASPGLVLNANKADQGTALTVQTQNSATGQSWRLGVEQDPATTSIRGREGLCLQPNGANTEVEMKKCVEDPEKIKWDLYSDGSIRVHNYINLCLTAHGRSAGSAVEIRACAVDTNQRWLFKNNGLLINPVSGLAMERKDPKYIVINPPDAQRRNQQWLPYFSGALSLSLVISTMYYEISPTHLSKSLRLWAVCVASHVTLVLSIVL